MQAIVFYILTVLIFFLIYSVYAWGINLQFGATGILNFTYITFVAAGAYFTGVTALGKAQGGVNGQYILGLNLPFPISPIIGGIAAGVLGAFVGFVGLRRLRSDYLAIATVAVGQIAWMVVGNAGSLFNGWDGLSGVPEPFNSILGLSFNDYQWIFLGVCIVAAAIGWIIAEWLFKSPYGRILKAIREDQDVAAALGKNVFLYKMSAFIIGCIYAGFGGALTIEYIGAFNPSGWTTPETFIIWAAMLVGGRGNNRGMIFGAFLVPVVFNEITRFLPQIPNHPLLIESIRGMAIGLLLILVVRFRPQGILPERKTLFGDRSAAPTSEGK